MASTLSLDAVCTAAASSTAAACAMAQRLPGGSWAAAALLLGWFGNRYLSDRALNNGNTPARFDAPNEIVVVTGGAGGIGAEIVKTLARRGVRVVVLDVLPLTYEKPANVFYYQVDLTNYDALQAVAARITKEVGSPTAAVANAGICRGKPILAASKRDIELTFAVNNLATLWTAKTFLPDMVRKNHGHFLIVASQTGYMATPGLTDYSATKAAAIALYEGLHAEVRNLYGAQAVRVSCVSPSAVDTKMFSGIKLSHGMVPLSPAQLGTRIADIICGGRARNIVVPAVATASAIFRALPDWVRVAMQASSTDIFSELKPHDPMQAVKDRAGA